MGLMELFKSMLLVQLFFSFAITGISYAIPADAKPYVGSFSDIANEINLNNVSTTIQSSINKQTSIPVIELGALVFYSGNLLIDLLLNFMFAIPEMVALIITGIMFMFNLDSYIVTLIQLFSSVIVTVIYFVSLIQLITSVRSQHNIT